MSQHILYELYNIMFPNGDTQHEHGADELMMVANVLREWHEKHTSTLPEKRAPVQGESRHRYVVPAGSVTWSEYLLAYAAYARRFGLEQSPERLAERGGFALSELTLYLGRPPKTWAPADAKTPKEEEL